MLDGQAVLYLWPDYGWVRGTVARRSRAAGFSHVVRYRVGGGALAPGLGRRLARPRRPLGAPHAPVWLPFSGTTVMVRPAAGWISE